MAVFKFKAFADDQGSSSSGICPKKSKNNLEEWDNPGNQDFLFYPQCFKRLPLFQVH